MQKFEIDLAVENKKRRREGMPALYEESGYTEYLEGYAREKAREEAQVRAQGGIAAEVNPMRTIKMLFPDKDIRQL